MNDIRIKAKIMSLAEQLAEMIELEPEMAGYNSVESAKDILDALEDIQYNAHLQMELDLEGASPI